MKLKYTEKKTLACRGAVNQEPDEDVDGILMVGDKVISLEPSSHSRFGHDSNRIRPAIHNGKRVWLKLSVWSPSRGYCAEGTTENIITFEDGVKVLIENGYFSFPITEDEKDEIVRDGIANHRHGEYDYYHPIDRTHKEE